MRVSMFTKALLVFFFIVCIYFAFFKEKSRPMQHIVDARQEVLNIEDAGNMKMAGSWDVRVLRFFAKPGAIMKIIPTTKYFLDEDNFRVKISYAGADKCAYQFGGLKNIMGWDSKCSPKKMLLPCSFEKQELARMITQYFNSAYLSDCTDVKLFEEMEMVRTDDYLWISSLSKSQCTVKAFSNEKIAVECTVIIGERGAEPAIYFFIANKKR